MEFFQLLKSSPKLLEQIAANEKYDSKKKQSNLSGGESTSSSLMDLSSLDGAASTSSSVADLENLI